MKFPEVFKTKTATTGRNNFDLSCNHLTTMDFGFLRPVYYRQLNEGDKIKVDASLFSRVNPLEFPVFGDVRFETRAFFVPFDQIYDSWKDFRSNKLTHVQGDGTVGVPTISRFYQYELAALFVGKNDLVNNTDHDSMPPSNAREYDFIFYDQDGIFTPQEDVYYWGNFTRKGKAFLSIIYSLGYSINWSTTDRTYVNSSNILALLKIYLDWYINPKFDYSRYESFFRQNYSYFGGVEDEAYEKLYDILDLVYKVSYSPDYFVSAQTNLLKNNDNSIVDFHLTDTQGNDIVDSDSDSVIVTVNTDNWSLNLLKNLSDFLKRNNVAGSRYVDQLLARYGVRPSDIVANRSQYIGTMFTQVQVSDVMQTAPNFESSTYGVGDYTGKAIAGSQDSFYYDNTGDNVCYGVFMILTTLRPRTQYYQGRDRVLSQFDNLDFYTPEFDGKNMQAVRFDELLADYFDGNDFTTAENNARPDAIWGYTSRYAHNKVARDFLTGDFRINRFDNTMRTMHLFRFISRPDDSDPGMSIVNNEQFDTFVDKDSRLYDRIFQVPGSDLNYPVDHFICNFVFKVNLNSTMKSISESLLPEDGGKELNIAPYGLKF